MNVGVSWPPQWSPGKYSSAVSFPLNTSMYLFSWLPIYWDGRCDVFTSSQGISLRHNLPLPNSQIEHLTVRQDFAEEGNVIRRKHLDG